jgi:hypothetical protein
MIFKSVQVDSITKVKNMLDKLATAIITTEPTQQPSFYFDMRADSLAAMGQSIFSPFTSFQTRLPT